MSAPHSESYVDSEGEERCSTCDKWLEPGYYDIEDHARAMEGRIPSGLDEFAADTTTNPEA
mgnify:CR=1 FL=1